MSALLRRPGDTVTWHRCPSCASLQYAKRLQRLHQVCPECDHHGTLTAADRITLLTDAGSFTPFPEQVRATDPLTFVDSTPYTERLGNARRVTGRPNGVLAGRATVAGVPVGIAVMDFAFMGGSLGAAEGEVLTRTAETCLRERRQFVVVTASGGARMQEGALALMQMAKVSQALVSLREAGLLSVSVITDPTYGGVAASFATSCDVLVAEKNARMGFAGRRVIAQTIGEDLPDDFQTAGFLLEHGHVDAVVHRHELAGWLGRLLSVVTSRPVARRLDRISPAVLTDPATVPPTDAWAAIGRARDVTRPTASDHLANAFEAFVELHGDRANSDCSAVIGGLATLEGRPVMVVGHQKGHSTRELVQRQFGMADADGYRKTLRLMRLADQLGVPVVALVDTPGAYPGRAAEERGQSFAIADSIAAMFELRVPVVSVVTGEGGSGGALALAAADRVLMFENSTYSVISPEGCSAILWSDASLAPTAAAALRITSRELLELGVVDGVLREPAPELPAVERAAAMTATLHDALVRTLDTLGGLDAVELVAARRARFRAVGAGAFTASASSPAANRAVA